METHRRSGDGRKSAAGLRSARGGFTSPAHASPGGPDKTSLRSGEAARAGCGTAASGATNPKRPGEAGALLYCELDGYDGRLLIVKLYSITRRRCRLPLPPSCNSVRWESVKMCDIGHGARVKLTLRARRSAADHNPPAIPRRRMKSHKTPTVTKSRWDRSGVEHSRYSFKVTRLGHEDTSGRVCGATA